MNRTSLQSYARALRVDAGMRPASALRGSLLLMLLCLMAVGGRAQTTISTLSSWDGAQAAYPLGVPASVAADVYGQVFTVPANGPILTDFKVNAAWSWGQGVTLTPSIAEWDGQEAAGSPLWTGSAVTVDSSQSGFTQLDFPISNLTLTPGNQYVFYLVASNESGGPATASVGVTGPVSSSPSGGGFVFTHSYGDASNLLYLWDQPDGSSTWGDLAFAATFSSAATYTPPASLQVTAPTTATAGSAIQFTVTAYDVYGNVQTNYTGPVQFSSTDGGATLPASSQLTAGVGTFQATLNTTGTQTITAKDASNSSLSATSGSIVVSAPSSSSGSSGPVDHLAFSNLPNFSDGAGNIPSGTTFSSTVTAYDANGNVVTGYTGTLHFTSTDYAALLPIDTALVNGVGNFGFGLICYSSPCTLTATDTSNPSLTVTSAPINVTAPAVGSLALVGFPIITASGTQFSAPVGELDQNGLPTTGYSGDSVHFTSTDPNMSVTITLPGVGTIPWTDGPLPGGAAVLNFVLSTAGVQTITATDVSNSAITGASNAITVTAGSPTSLVFTGMPTTIAPGTPFQATVSGKDAQGNLTTGLTDVIHFTSSDGSAVLPADTALVKGTGTFTFTLNTAGAQTITATDTTVSTLTGTSNSVSVQPSGPAAIHVVSGAGQMTAIGTAFSSPLTVKVMDANGNAVSGATVQFTAPSSGASATFSSSTATTASDGTASVTATANGTASSTSYTVTASVSGVSTPASFSLINQQAKTTVQLSATPASPVYGQPLTLTATLTQSSAGGTTPTGTMAFRDGTTELTNSGTLDSGVSGFTSSYTIQTPAVGAHDFAAIYSGDSNFWYSDAKATVTVGKASSSLQGPATLPTITSAAGGTIPIQVTGQFSGTGIATPSGTISYTIDGGTAATAAINSGSASVAIASGIGSGAHTILVSYSGDSNYAAAANLTINLTVPAAADATTTTWTGAATVALGQSYIFTVTVADTTTPSTTPTGTVTITEQGSPIAAYPNPIPLSNGTAVLSNLNLAVGSHTLNATFSDTSGKFKSSSSSLTVTVNKATATLTLGTVPAISYGQSGTEQITVTGVSGVAVPSGTVSWSILNASNSSVAQGTSSLTAGTASSTATLAIPGTLAAGSYTISTTYAGDANYGAAATPVTAPLTVSKGLPILTWHPSASSIPYGTTLSGILDATASFNSNSVAGTAVYTATPSGGTASTVTAATVLGAGSYQLAVTFTPTDGTDYQTATGSASIIVTKAAPTISLVSSANPAIITSAVTFTATVAAPASTPTGSVSFYDGTTLLGSVAFSNTSSAAYTTSSLSAGTHSITAVYSGDANFISATSSAVAELVQSFTVSTSSGSASTPTQTVPPGQPATFGFTIQAQSSPLTTPVVFSALGMPTGATAIFNPPTVIPGLTVSSFTMTIQTPKPTATSQRTIPLKGAPFLLCFLILPFARKLRRAGKKLSRTIALLLFLAGGAAALLGLNGCGAQAGFFGQQSQTYTITVVGTVDGTPLQVATVKLVVE